MIRYDLRCSNGCVFEAWFRDSAAYDAQRAQGAVTCAVCGGGEVEKAVMAPAVRGRKAAPDASKAAAAPALSAPPASPVAQSLAALRAHVEANVEHVGPRFAAEARRIHLGDAPERAIWGEATPQEVRSLKEDGVPVAPLPFSRRDD
ncbi:MAG: DUF1178 family protein [Rubrimonas sp.]|uniref:DUF1178 family protein n=1 Tax=Rubrimonas sp. TaxID=2036015 RepID=UPI002FDDA9A4